MAIHSESLTLRVDTKVIGIVVEFENGVFFPVVDICNIANFFVVSSERVCYVVVRTRAVLTIAVLMRNVSMILVICIVLCWLRSRSHLMIVLHLSPEVAGH